ncbi:MAG: hypothetical protein AAGJ73_08770 [Pseudomonadota bacterium]
MNLLKVSLFAVTAFATSLGVSAPAFAGGGPAQVSVAVSGGGKFYRGGRGYYGRGYYRSGRGFRHRGYARGGYARGGYRGGYRRGYRRGGGGKAAGIALGVIGGAIILNELAEADRARADARARYDDQRYRRYDPRRDDYYYERGQKRGQERGEERRFDDGADRAREEAFDRRQAELDRREEELRRREAELRERAAQDFDDRAEEPDFDRGSGRFEDPDRRDDVFEDDRRNDVRRDNRRGNRLEDGSVDEDAPNRFEDSPRPAPSSPVERDDLEDDLLGGEEVENEAVIFSIQAAYNQCAAEARRAASRDGHFVAMPAAPTAVKPLSPTLVRLEADLTAQDQRGRQFLRTLTCEADPDQITFLRLS